MSHPTEDDLVLFHYGEGDDPSAVEAHLGACAACRAAHEDLGRVLGAADDWPVPERGKVYGAEVWERLRPRLRPRPASLVRRAWLPASVAASLLAAFLLGRHVAPPAPPPQALSAPVRERILLVAVGDHLERSQMVLVELANASPTAVMDIASEQTLARELVGANRLYRQTALRAGEARVADVLDDLERILVEISHSPQTLTPAELRVLQQRIAARGILFKVRVIDSQVREREQRAAKAKPASFS